MNDLIPFFWAVFGLLTVIINVVFAIGIYDDATDLLRNKKQKTVFVKGEIWTLATLLGGVFVAGIYWVIHHSTLSQSNEISEK